jgi:CDGSH-type Zn-finger protein
MTESIVAQKGPFAVEVVAGRRYFWCACGRSKRQPFCDGSHAGTGLTPVPFAATANEQVWFCGCKRTGTKPFCDDSHEAL